MINIGIIGYGKMGQIRHQAIAEKKDIKVIQLCDPSSVDTQIALTDNLDEIIYNANIDAVFICTPNYLNKKLTIQCLQAGKHVFCEKQPAFTAKEVEEICLVEKESQKILMYGFNHRHHSSIKDMLR